MEDFKLANESISGGEIADDAARRTLQRLDDAASKVAEVCGSVQRKILSTLEVRKPTEIAIELGVNLAGGAAVPLICSGSVEGTFQISK